MEGTLTEAIQAVPTMEIVQQFNIPFQNRNGKTYLLCPGHDDQHFGSCYIDKKDNGYYCYACNEHVEKWDMLLKVSGFSHKDAAKWFFETSGITPSKFSVNPLANINKLINRISEIVDNSPVYDDWYDCKKLESSYGRNINGDYLFSDLASGNPLLDLYKNNKELFKTVVLNVLHRKQERLLDIEKQYSKPGYKYKGIDGKDIAASAKKEWEQIEALIQETIEI